MSNFRNFLIRESQPELTDIGTPIIYETVSLDCEVADVDPRIVEEMKRKLRGE